MVIYHGSLMIYHGRKKKKSPTKQIQEVHSTSSKLHLLPLRKGLNAPNDLLEAKLLPTHGQHDYPPKIGIKAFRWKLAKSSSGLFLSNPKSCLFWEVFLGWDWKAIRSCWVFNDLGWKEWAGWLAKSHSKYPICGTKKTNVSPYLCIPNKSWIFLPAFFFGILGSLWELSMSPWPW